jgi:hypothetical protein
MAMSRSILITQRVTWEIYHPPTWRQQKFRNDERRLSMTYCNTVEKDIKVNRHDAVHLLTVTLWTDTLRIGATAIFYSHRQKPLATFSSTVP